jgi:hypothetical protein
MHMLCNTNGGMMVNDELERMWNETVLASFGATIPKTVYEIPLSPLRDSNPKLPAYESLDSGYTGNTKY